jgi:sterol desaturase/sphingolipid hydroxylase (fatty acid hydroxylase superfamily)
MASHEPSSWLGGAWGAVFAACLGAVYIGLALGGQGDTVLLGITALAGLLLVAAERVRPRERGWREADGQWWNDLGHFVASFGVGSFAGAWLAGVAVTAPLVHAWPVAWPMAAQAVLGLVVAEFFGYWQHRLLHSVPWLWPLHALHHSTSRMTFFKATRIHALDIGSFTFVSVAPLLALGASTEVVLWVTAFGNFAAQTQHANIALPTPAWVNAIVGTPAVHWLHHSLDMREGNSNFGMNLMLFDHLFGTYIPPSPEPPAAFGIQPDFVPRGFLGQLALPIESIRRLLRRES